MAVPTVLVKTDARATIPTLWPADGIANAESNRQSSWSEVEIARVRRAYDVLTIAD
jgi:hypothetical protein